MTATIVAYNSVDVISNALKSLLCCPAITEIIVVDNCSTDDTCELIKRDFPEVTLIENPKNDGFGRGHNIALKRITTPYALLFNPDAVLTEGALDALITAAEKYPDAAILAPALYGVDGKRHHSFKRNVFSRERSSGIFTPPDGDCCADFLSGAVWLCNMKHLRAIGFFDPNIFLYYEDDDLCLRARKAGGGLVYVPEAKSIHLMGSSSGKYNAGADYFKQRHMVWSRLYLEQKYKGKESAHKLASMLNLQYGFKAAFYRLILDKKKFNRYQGRLAGVFEFTESAEKLRIP